MMFRSFDPFREFDRAFDAPRVASVPVDVVRREHGVVVYLDVPGVDPATLDITVDKNTLTIEGERPDPLAEGDKVIAAERPRGSFRRQLFLGTELDAVGVAAESEHGVLTITIPFAESAKPRKVLIGTGGALTEGDGDA